MRPRRTSAALLLCLLAISGCKLVLFIFRPFDGSAIPGQDPIPREESKRAKFVETSELLRDVEYLSSPDCNGRFVGTPGSALARAYIQERMTRSGLAVSTQPFTFKRFKSDTEEVEVTGTNVIGVLRGEESGSKWITITAHYDHLGRSQKKSTYYPGADDNAAGVAALFALAEHFSKEPTRHNLLFIALDAEELGLIGAEFFLKENTIAPKEQIAFNLNLDMISRSEEEELFAITHNTPDQEPLRKMLFALQREVGFRLMVSVDDRSMRAMDSDHGEFAKNKIPFIYLGVADHEDYHTPADVIQKIEPRFYTAVVDGIVLIVRGLDQLLPL